MQAVDGAVLTQVERRRRFGAEEKRQLVAETLRPGASVGAVAREHGVHPNQLFKWRRLAREGLLAGTAAPFVPVVLSEPGRAADRRRAAEARVHAFEVLLCNGRVLRLDETIDPAVAARFASALDGDDR
jgi:transposase